MCSRSRSELQTQASEPKEERALFPIPSGPEESCDTGGDVLVTAV